MSSGDEPKPENLGFAQTVTPVAGTPIVAPIQTQDSDDFERPESDKLQRAVARSRVGAKLFAKKA